MIIKVEDNYKARQLYHKAYFYSQSGYKNGAEVIKSLADKVNHSWEEHIIKIKGEEIRLRLYTPHDENGNPKFGEESLEIEFLSSLESSKKKLEGMTGIRIKDKL